jgi:TRAP-type mannitol/chloroaromatic compound transport system permease small subunit
MAALLHLTGYVDRISRFFAYIAAVLVLATCTISAFNAVSRYAFDLSSNAWLEIQWQLFAGIFMLASAHVLQVNGHVRVDMLYGSYSPRGKLWVDVFGIIFFLIPSVSVMIWLGWSFFLKSYMDAEMSSNAGGLPYWPVKALMPFGFALLLLQGLAELIKRIAALQGAQVEKIEYEALQQ